MAPESLQRVRRVFDEAMQKPEPERLRFVEEACTGDANLLESVQRLLRAHSASESFLHTSVGQAARVGRYLIRGELGRGAMGVVYDAVDPLIGRSVAIKVIHLKGAGFEDQPDFLRERLFREAHSAGRLFHPGIVVIFDVGQDGDLAFIAMESVEGLSLDRWLVSRPPLSTSQTLAILHQTAAALDYAHEHGVIHRDIKPANIMLSSDLSVKVADFGIAKIVSSQQVTATGVVMGTPSYMSPEQIEGRPVSGRSDQFSLAVLAYELLTGSKPFEADTMVTLAHLIVYGPRPRAHSQKPALPEGIDEIFERGLHRFPEQRFPTCAEFVAALERTLQLQPAKHARKRISRAVVLSLIVVISFAVLAVVFLPGDFKENFQRIAALLMTRPPSRETIVPKVLAAPAPPAAKQSEVLPPTVKTGREAAADFRNVTRPPAPEEVKPKPVPAAIRAKQLYSAAVEKQKAGRPEEATALFRRAADLGETDAMMQLGESYHSGDGLSQDAQQALQWFRRAAEAGNSSGMVSAGAMYLLGDGVANDDDEALRWFQKAADRGNAAGIYDLATMYENGRGVTRDLEKAKELYRKAAGLGESEAQNRLFQLERAR